MSAAREHDELLLLDKHGRVVVSQGVPQNGAWRQLVAQATQQSDPSTELTNDRAIAVQTVWGDGKLSGTADRHRGARTAHRAAQPEHRQPVAVPGRAQRRRDGRRGAHRHLLRPLGRQAARPAGHRRAQDRRRRPDGPRQDQVRPARAAPDGRHLQHDGRTARGPRARAPGDARRRLAPAAHPAYRAPAAPRPARGGLRARRPPPSWPARRRRSPGSPGWSTACSPPRAPSRVTEQLEQIDVVEAVRERVAAWQPVADGNGVKLVAERRRPATARSSPSAPGTWSRSSTTCSTTRSRRIGDRGRHASVSRSPGRRRASC